MNLLADGRHWQIAALATLLAFNIASLDYGASWLPSVVAITSAIATQCLLARGFGRKLEPRSALISGLSLSLLLRGDALWVMAGGGVAAIASKFLLRPRGKHVWNPACFGIVTMLCTGHAWVSPGQWGASTTLVSFFVLLAMMVLARVNRVGTALFFLGSYASLLLWRAAWLGDPWTIPLHQLENGSLLLFSFFMVTDPRTTPDRLWVRLLFVAGVGLLGYKLAFVLQWRTALYWSLFLLAPLVPLLDALLPAERFTWRPRAPLSEITA